MADQTDASVTAPAPARPERLTPDDDLFVRMEQALDLPVVNQVVWRIPGELARADFDRLASGLSHSRLARLVRRSPLPVRDRWFHSVSAGVSHYADDPIPASSILDWARGQAGAGFDVVAGPSWRISAVRSADTDETFVTWTGSHVIGDGGAVLGGIAEVLVGVPFDTTNAPTGIVDTLTELGSSIGGSVKAAVRLIRTRPQPIVRPEARPVPAVDESSWGGVSPTAVVTIDGGAYDAAASAAGGTMTTLFAAIVIGVLEATGRVVEGDVVPLSLPMSTRTPGDRRANATTGVTARIPVTADRYHDLSPLRTATKAAYGELSAGPGQLSLLGRIAQPLGDGLVRRLAADSRAPLCLASTLGTLDPTFAGLGTGTPGSVALRSVTVGTTAETLRRMQGGVSAWLGRSAGSITLCMTSLDPDRVADDAALTGLITRELDRWGLSAKSW
ncbi:hypothetical protein [Gordonia desulfuricans]|nr:hypothetical protein [Gordonia desulfuricans]